MIPVHDLFEVHLTVADLERSIAFYRDAVGLRLARTDSHRPQGDVREHDDRGAALEVFEVFLEPLNLFGPERAEPARLEVETLTKPIKWTPPWGSGAALIFATARAGCRDVGVRRLIESDVAIANLHEAESLSIVRHHRRAG